MSESIDDDSTDYQRGASIINDCQLGGGQGINDDDNSNNTEEERTSSISTSPDIQQEQQQESNILTTRRTTTTLKRYRRRCRSQYNFIIKAGILCLLLLSSTLVASAAAETIVPRAAKDEKQTVLGGSALRERVKKRGRQSSKKKYTLDNDYDGQKRDRQYGGVRRKLQRWQASSAWHSSGDTTTSAAQWQPAWPKPHSTTATTTKSSKKAVSTSTKSSKDTTTTSYSKDMLPPPIYKHPTSSPIQQTRPTTSSPTNLKETLSPTINPTSSSTSTPSLSPSYSPSDHPSASPSSNPTDVPSTSPTNLPTNEPSYSPTISPIIGSLSPTAPSMMKEMTQSPMADNIIPEEPTAVPIQNGTTSSPSSNVNGTTSPSSMSGDNTTTPTYSPSLPDGVTLSPSNVNSTTTNFPSSTPTISLPNQTVGTASPTVSITVSQRSSLQMKLYGLSETLSNDERIVYQDMTVAYMEQFYNNDVDDSIGGEGEGSSDGGTSGVIRNDVYDMSIQLLTKNGGEFEEGEVVNDDDIFGIEGNPGIEDGDDLFTLKTTRDIELEEKESEDESYLPKFAINARRKAQVIPSSSIRMNQAIKSSQQHSSRHLEQEQTVVQTSVTEPCLDTNPLTITFDIILEYRTTNTQLQDSNLVISFPFSTIDFRTVYIDDYLKNGGEEVGSSSEVFDSLYCTSRIDFGDDDDDDDNDGEDPTLPPVSIGTMSPVVSDNTTTPTYSPASLPDDMTASPTISSMPTNDGISPSSSPSQGKGEGNTTETYMPTMIPTFNPTTSGNGTLSPSSNTTILNGTLVPTTSPAPSSVNLTFTTSTLVNETNETTIIDVLDSNENFTSLVAAIEAANLIEVLNGDGSFTVFAPTNEAFEALPQGTVDFLLQPENIEILQSILTYHVVDGYLTSSTLSNGGTFATLNGASVNVTLSEDGSVKINNSTVIIADILASNGIIHAIDAILDPPLPSDDDGNSTSNGTLAPSLTPTNGTLMPTPLLPDDMTTTLPTTIVITPESVPNLDMKLYGITEELSTIDEELYNTRTASYIEDFYNKYNVESSTDDDDESVRGEVVDVVATVEITSQEVDRGGNNDEPGLDVASELDSEINADLGFGKKKKRSPNLNPLMHSRIGTLPDQSEDEAFLPEQGVDAQYDLRPKLTTQHHNVAIKPHKGPRHKVHHNVITVSHQGPRQHNRQGSSKARKLQVDNCSGPGLDLIFTVTLEYRLQGTNSTSISQYEIINEPFSTPEHREVYQNEYLIQPSDPVQLFGPFDGLTCTSAVGGLPGSTLSPTSTPTGGSMSSPTMESTDDEDTEGTIIDVAAGNDNFAELVKYIEAADLVDTLSGEGPFTVFAPTNEAFAALPEGFEDALLSPDNIEILQGILTYHVIDGYLTSTTLSNGGSFVTLNGASVNVTLSEDGSVKINNSTVIIADILASNGIIHAIDAVLDPPIPSDDDGNSTVNGALSPTVSPQDGTMSPTPLLPDDSSNITCPESLDHSHEINSESTLYYALVPSNPPEAVNGILCARLEVLDNDNGWIGLGFSTNGFMQGSQAVVGIPDEDTVLKYDLSGNIASVMSDEDQTLTGTSIVTNSVLTTMEFTKLLVEEGQVPILEDGENIFLHAWGGPALGYHIGRLSFPIDFEGGISDDASNDDGSSKAPSPSSMMTAPPFDGTSSPTSNSTESIVNGTTTSPNSMGSYVPTTYFPTSSPVVGGAASPASTNSTTDTLAPVGMVSDGSMPPNSGGSSTTVTPDPKSDLEMDLIGLVSLSFSDQFQYTEKTANYITSFYNDDVGSLPPDDLRSVLSDVNGVSINIQDQIIPMGDITGFDCSQIDPLTIIYTLQMTYTTSDPDVSFDDVITYPFREQFHQQYINDLKENDMDNAFGTLQCISEVRIPEVDDTLGAEVIMPTFPPVEDENGTVTDTDSQIMPGTDDLFAIDPADETDTSGVDNMIPDGSIPDDSEIMTPGVVTSPMEDDIFSLRMVGPSANNEYERKCTDDLRLISKDSVDEFEVSFVYGVESSEEDYSTYLDNLETLILDYIATSVLHCGSDAHQSVQLRKKRSDGNDTNDDTPDVVRIRYPEFGQITSVSKCDPTLSQAKGCVMLETELLVTSIDSTSTVEVHHNILHSLQDAFKKNVFTEFIPELLTTSYLGPEPEVSTLSSSNSTEEIHVSSSSYIGSIVVVSLGCAMLLLILIACRAPSIQKSKASVLHKVIMYYKSKRNRALPTSSGPIIENGGVMVPLSSNQSEDEIIIFSSNTEDDLDDSSVMRYSDHHQSEDQLDTIKEHTDDDGQGNIRQFY